MPQSKRPMFAYLLLAAVLGVIAAAFGPAGRASADTTDTITAVSVTSPDSDRGNLSVTIDSTTELTALTVHLTDARGVDVLDPAMTLGTPMATATGYETVATVTTPIGFGDLPLGSYTVTVDATDAGASVSGLSAGTLLWVEVPHVTLIVAPTRVSYDDTMVTASGKVTLTLPDGTQLADSLGTVTLSGGTGLAQPVTTAGDGTFTGQLTMPSGGTVTAQVNATQAMLAGYATASVGLTADAIQFSNTRVSQPTINYGAADVLTGTLEYLPNNTGTTYQPLRGQPVKVYNSLYPSTVAATGITGGNGTFSITLPTSGKVTSTWTVKAGGLIGDARFGAAQASVKMTVRVPVTVSNFTVTLNQYWRLGYSGCLGLAKSIPGAKFTSTANLVLQYSASGPNGPWKNILWKPPVKRTCGNGGVWFSGSTIAPMNYAYYRLRYNGMTSAGTVYLAANSASALAWKYADRIAGFSVAPKTVAKGGKLTVKGQLQYYASYKWHNYGGQLIYIIFRKQGTSAWYWIVKVKTNSTGHFSATVKDWVGSATWSAQFNGNSTHLAASPPGVYVRVT